MAYIKTVTRTKTESTPEDAFSTYPHPDPVQLAEFLSTHGATRTVEETANSMTIELIFPTAESAMAAATSELQEDMNRKRAVWVAENNVTESFTHREVE